MRHFFFWIAFSFGATLFFVLCSKLWLELKIKLYKLFTEVFFLKEIKCYSKNPDSRKSYVNISSHNILIL